MEGDHAGRAPATFSHAARAGDDPADRAIVLSGLALRLDSAGGVTAVLAVRVRAPVGGLTCRGVQPFCSTLRMAGKAWLPSLGDKRRLLDSAASSTCRRQDFPLGTVGAGYGPTRSRQGRSRSAARDSTGLHGLCIGSVTRSAGADRRCPHFGAAPSTVTSFGGLVWQQRFRDALPFASGASRRRRRRPIAWSRPMPVTKASASVSPSCQLRSRSAPPCTLPTTAHGIAAARPRRPPSLSPVR